MFTEKEVKAPNGIGFIVILFLVQLSALSLTIYSLPNNPALTIFGFNS